MTGPRIGAAFAGYGGLEMGVQAALGGSVAWHSEYEPPTEKNPRPDQAAARILAHHWPDVPNLGDITRVDWTDVEPVDILTGGSPCQDVSTAGKRQGMRPGTRSGLWAAMVDAILILRPRLVVWENVRGVTSACADSELESCPRCVGGTGPHRPVLRALGRVLGDLADLGYDTQWHGLSASDVGAPHGRFREFVFATDANHPGRDEQRWARADATQHPAAQRGATADAERCGQPGRSPVPVGQPVGRALTAGHCAAAAADAARNGRHQRRPESAGQLGRPHVAIGGDAVPHAPRFAWSLEPRDCADDCQRDRDWRIWNWQRGEADDYGPAIRRWHDLTSCVPMPTEPASRGDGQRLAPRFTEWMQGLHPGHVTAPAIGISRNAQLKALGNGVVPQQAHAATGLWLRYSAELAGAA